MKFKKLCLLFLLSSLPFMIFTSSCGTGAETENVTETEISETTAESTSYLETSKTNDTDNVKDTAETENSDYLNAVLDFGKTYQTMIGFGAGYTWYSERMLYPAIKNEVADLLFKDAKLTVLRFKNEYLYSNVKINEKCRENQIYELARERADEYGETPVVLMSCWSPPQSLKSNGTTKGKGTLKKDENGNFMYKEYGEWWAQAAEAYINAGVPIDYISIQNECDYEAEWDGMELSAFESDKNATYSKAFLSVYDSLQAALGKNAPLMIAPETMSCVPATLKQYIRPILEVKPESVAGIAHHLYVGGDSSESGGKSSCNPDSFNMNFRENYAEFGSKYPIWQTEFFRGSPLETAGIIHNSLVNEGVSSYIYWGGIWEGKEAQSNIITVESNGNYHVGSVYWVMRHFSEFIRPGYERIQVNYPIKNGVKISAFVNSDKSKLAVVIINPTTEEADVKLAADGMNVKNSEIYQTVLTDDDYNYGEYYNNLGALSGDNSVVVSPMSITTVSVELS